MRNIRIKTCLFALLFAFESVAVGYAPASAQVVSENAVAEQVVTETVENADIINENAMQENVKAEEVSAEKATIVHSGIDGALEWSIDTNGHLVISGTGNYEFAAWGNYSEDIKTAEVNVSGITSTSKMFANCTNMTSVDLSKLDTSSVTDMSYMFWECKGLKSLDISGFDTSNAENMDSMFNGSGIQYIIAPENKSSQKLCLPITNGFAWIYQPTKERVTEITKAGIYRERLDPKVVNGTVFSSEDLTGTGIPENSTFTVMSTDSLSPEVAFNGVDDVNAPEVEIPETVTYNDVTYKVTMISIEEDFTSEKDGAKYSVRANIVGQQSVIYRGLTNKEKTTVKIPEYTVYKGIRFTVEAVGTKAFKDNKKIESVNAPSIKRIKREAFSGCTNLKTVTVGKNLETIGYNTFRNCKKLTKVTINSKKLSVIENNAFYNCTSLKNLTFNSTKLTRIGLGAFKNCKKLTKITLKTKKLNKVGKNALKGVNKNCKIKVPKSKVNKYAKLFKNKGLKTVNVTK